MRQVLSPIAASRAIGESYLRYLKARYAPADDDLRAELYESLDHGFRSTRGPFLQAASAYQKGESLQTLIADGLMHPRLQELDHDVLPPDRPLYRHQEMALRKAADGRNLVIATGTGSGKTECYLLPILDHLLREADAGTLGEPGVRAMLLYPMNALANDQMIRIRGLTRPFPNITFGRYTGATPERRREGEQQFRTDFGRDPEPGELVSREQMRAAPPHILLTNYAMLEYLLLRPADTTFFDGTTGQHWRFVILDEMHIYNGARGAEIAMLLRRVRDRVNGSKRGQLRMVGTSATLGSGGDAPKRIAEYAADLFGERVEHHSHDEFRQDVVLPAVEPPPAPPNPWRAPKGAFHSFWNALASGNTASEVLDLVPEDVLERTGTDIRALTSALRSEQQVIRLARLLHDGPLDVSEQQDLVLTDPSRADELPALLAVCTNSYADAAPLVPARYHYMLRALEGAFLCKSPKHPTGAPRLRLERHLTCPECEVADVRSQMFEFGVCSRCSAEFLIGDDARPDEDGRLAVTQAPPQGRNLMYLLLGHQIENDDEDEAAVIDDSEVEAEVDRRRLCTACGKLCESTGDACDCGAPDASMIVTYAKPKRGQPLRRCPACSGRTRAEIVLRFFTGHDAPVSVVATSLYQSLPPEEPPDGQVIGIGEGRKLLTFSDSRQDAAFFAPYLHRTYARAVQRRLIWDALDRNRSDELRFEDIVPLVQKLAEDSLVIDPDDSAASKKSQVRRWLMAEILATDRRQSLDGVGLAEITVAVPRSVNVPPAIQRLGFSDQEALDIAAVLLDSLRRQAAVHLPDGVDVSDQAFAPRNIVTSVRAEDRANRVMSWLPARGRNSRLDYLTKIFNQRGITGDPLEVLDGIWRWLTNGHSAWQKVLSPTTDRRHGTVFRLDPEWITMIPASDNHRPYECSKCRQIAWRNVNGICPVWCCDGKLMPARVEGSPTAAHYRHLYTTLIPSGMRVEEHTGQLETARARRFQQDFLDGKLNALSCTTTFELGVDLGDVKAVLMRNVPPSPANYVQRAGRAGRRASTPALVVTFARRRSHDLYHFQEPMRLIEGNVGVPILSLRNTLIARRHIHAVAFAAYERRHVDNGSAPHTSVSSFFVSRDGTPAPVDDFIEWLHSHPQDLAEAVNRITPEDIAEELGVHAWQWVHDLIDDSGGTNREHFGWLQRATNEIRSDLDEFDAEIAKTDQQIKEKRAAGLSREAESQLRRLTALYKVKGTLEDKRLINYLASRVVLPKYGFPVDVVTLDVWHDPTKEATDLDLSRDLTMGITEYAPGSKVVANKAIWESIGLRILPGKALIGRRYSECPKCGVFRTRIDAGDEGGDLVESCEGCSSTITDQKFLIPQFGFIGQRSKDQPGEAQPDKAGRSQSYFSDYDGDPPSIDKIPIGHTTVQARFSRQGRITVINAGRAERGFRVCLSCGHTEPTVSTNASKAKARAPHNRPGTGRECNGMLRLRHLGHHYLTDVVELDLMMQMPHTQARSTLYALLAATPALGIPTEDVAGVLGPTRTHGRQPLVIFDTVPGGAGHVTCIRDNLQRLLMAAHRIAKGCQCASSTSCYGCLRTYRNQEFHDLLSRGEATMALGRLVGPGAEPATDAQ